MIDAALAARFAALTLGHVEREYPNKLDHVMAGPEDVASPRALHPIFFGSFDWHSCVHGWWQLFHLARLHPALALEIHARADALFTPANGEAERTYFERPVSTGFERPYGWAWLLALHAEIAGTRWQASLDGLAGAVAARFSPYLAKLTYPIRAGTHGNSAFACILAWDARPALRPAIAEAARRWFGADRGCQAWEPGGDEFLSSALTEALVMSRVLGAHFAVWFDAFLPAIPPALLIAATVSDRGDGKIAHLDGLNFSRAWCWRGIAAALGPDHPASTVVQDAAERHIAASLPHIADDYAGEHWLATFALLALSP